MPGLFDHMDDREIDGAIQRLARQRAELPSLQARPTTQPQRNPLALHDAANHSTWRRTLIADVRRRSALTRPSSGQTSRGDNVARLLRSSLLPLTISSPRTEAMDMDYNHRLHVRRRAQLFDRLLALQLASAESSEPSFVPPPEPPQAAAPLDAREISALRASMLTLTSTLDDVCTICLEPRKKGNVVLRLGCGHCFHGACARNWLARSGCCPTCRKVLPRTGTSRSSSSQLYRTRP